MSNLTVKIEKEGVTFMGADLAIGAEMELDEKSAKSLIDSGHASDPAGKYPPQEIKDAETPPNDSTGGAGSGQAQTPEEVASNEATEELARVTKALDDKYNRDPLAEAAKEVEVEFPYNAKKSEIIQAIIDQGKAQALLNR